MPRWTPEARARQAELIQEWKPWNHSTGPRSDFGKRQSSQNATLTGDRATIREIAVLSRYSLALWSLAIKLHQQMLDDYKRHTQQRRF